MCTLYGLLLSITVINNTRPASSRGLPPNTVRHMADSTRSRGVRFHIDLIPSMHRSYGNAEAGTSRWRAGHC